MACLREDGYKLALELLELRLPW